jgi:epoxyqueuosine reductase
MGDMVYGCDICQDVCPWNRGVEKRRRGEAVPIDSTPVVSLAEWLDRDPAELVEEFDRLYVPRNDGRWLRRNALIAAGNVGGAALRPSIEREAASADPVLADVASWALARLAERGAA